MATLDMGNNTLDRVADINPLDASAASAMRTSLGLGTAAVEAAGAFDTAGAAASVLGSSCQRSSNLSDVASAGTSRTNLGILSGSDTLNAGTVTITAAITANSRIVVTLKDASPGAGNLTVSLSAPSADRSVGTSFVVRANIADGTINVLDTSTFDWMVIG